MRRPFAPMLGLLLLAGWGVADASTSYVSDELVLGVYSEVNNQGQRLATLHSGTAVELLTQNGEFSHVRLNDGTTGWVKSAYLTTQEPATARLKQLQEELDRSHATGPALAEAAARSEVERLTRELSAKEAQLDAVRTGTAVALPVASNATAHPGAPRWGSAGISPWVMAASVPLALAGGFWWGYASLARRVRQKFGGIKVY